MMYSTGGNMNSPAKVRCVIRMVADSILPYAESGPNDHPKDAPPFSITKIENGAFILLMYNHLKCNSSESYKNDP